VLKAVGHWPDIRRLLAFTLVELLVVIAIIGALVGLLLPAVQAAREASRRTQCQNNLRQIGVSLGNYESVRTDYPLGCIGCGAGNNEMLSWNAQLLPFLEQTTLAAEYQLDQPSFVSPNRELGATILPLFLCPSTPEDALHSDSGLWRTQAFTDYGGVYGVEGPGYDATEPNATQFLAHQWLGVFLFNEAVRPRQIADGLSNTVAVAERITRRISTSEWACGRNIFAQYNDNPLNRISGYGNEIGSPHPDGALVVFCDGHVEFLSDNIDQQTLNALLTKAGGEVE
jgi:prepilin-type processing-associated H-X9-DG protein